MRHREKSDGNLPTGEGRYNELAKRGFYPKEEQSRYDRCRKTTAKQMNGETNLLTLLQNMRPELQDGEFVFCSLEPAVASELCLSPIGQFLENEGLTMILARDEAEASQLNFTFPCRKITLKVHSSLEAIGFLAVVTEKLALEGISVNAISAYFHDHLFVSFEKAGDAMRVLSDMVNRAENQK